MSDLAHLTHVALLGCDHPHSGAHLQTLCSLDEAVGIHLWDPVPGVAEKLREAAGAKFIATHDDLDTLLSDERIGWLLVCVTNDVSAGVLLRCAAAGKPVLSEKPMGRSRAEVEPVVRAFRDRGLSLAVCFQNRYKPAALQLRAWVQEGLLGRVCSAETRLHTTQVALRNPRHWLFKMAQSGGGILPWLGCHYLDLMRFTMNSEVTAVTAHCATLSGEAIEVEDLACLTLRFANGALGTATFGYLMPGGRPGYLEPGYDTYFGLKGTLGHATWAPTGTPQTIDLLSCHPTWVGAPRRTLTVEEATAKAYGGRCGLEFARDCLKAAQSGTDGPATGEDMLAVWSIIEGAFRSQAEGVRVEA